MSSRKQDSQKLLELAEVAATSADNLQKVATLLGGYNEALNSLEQRIIELEQANDDLDRRLLGLERTKERPPFRCDPYDK